jgi:WD40 repeat protein
VTSAEGKVSVVQLGTTIKKTADFNGAAKFTHVSDVTPDGSIVAAGAQDGILRIWTIKDRKLLHQLKPRIKLSDSLAGNK